MGYLERVYRGTEDENRRVILEQMPPRPGAKLLDLGCGDGKWTIEIAAHVAAGEAHGVEMVEPIADQARANGVQVVAGDLSEKISAYEDSSFDVIHSNQVIEHIKNTDRFMAEIYRLLKPDGYAVVSTNNLSSWHNIFSLVFGWQPMPCNVSDWVLVGNPANQYEGFEHDYPGQTHLRIFTGRALTGLAGLHGLRPQSEVAAGFYPFLPSVGRRLARIDRLHGAFLVHRFERDPDLDRKRVRLDDE